MPRGYERVGKVRTGRPGRPKTLLERDGKLLPGGVGVSGNPGCSLRGDVSNGLQTGWLAVGGAGSS